MTNYKKYKDANDTFEDTAVKMLLTNLCVEAGLAPDTERYMAMYHDIQRWLKEEAK